MIPDVPRVPRGSAAEQITEAYRQLALVRDAAQWELETLNDEIIKLSTRLGELEAKAKELDEGVNGLNSSGRS